MTSKTERKFKKKKEREKKSHAKVVLRREAQHKKEAEERAAWRHGKRIVKLQRNLDHYGEYYPPEVYFELPPATIEQLEHNVQILRALENEWSVEQTERAAMNAELEAEGHLTLEQKLKAAHDRLVNQQKEAVESLPLDVRFKGQPKETAEVGVIKASQRLPEPTAEVLEGPFNDAVTRTFLEESESQENSSI